MTAAGRRITRRKVAMCSLFLFYRVVGWINAVQLTNTYAYEKRSKAMDGSRPSERILDGSNGANANAMLTVFLKSLGIVQITMHNYHQLLDVLAGDEKARVKRLIKKRFGITVP